MASKVNSKNRDDNPPSSASISHRPYNLHHNQSQAGTAAKGTKSVRSKKTKFLLLFLEYQQMIQLH